MPWLAIVLALLGVFFVIWGREQRATEAYLREMPFGPHILKTLDVIDSILTPRDPELERHVREVIANYDPDTKAALRTLYHTRRPIP